MPSMSLGSSGCRTLSTTAWTPASPAGGRALNASFRFAGTTTSLTSGLPSRDTWTKSPEAAEVPSAALVVIEARSVVDQTPMTGSSPATSSEIGTCSATAFTLNPSKVSMPTSDRSPPYSKSKTRRSRKNGSSA